jgi:predicted ABC-type ATPase
MKKLFAAFAQLILIFSTANAEMEEKSMNVCDLNAIYGSTYSYSLPRGVMESFLSGKAFDHPNVYTAEESEALAVDIQAIYTKAMGQNPQRLPVAVMTAGAPGAGKTIKMRQELSQNGGFAYMDPDDVCLREMERTYGRMVAESDGSPEARLAAYNKWRPGSNAAAHLALANLIRDQYAFYFGTTSTGAATSRFFEFLKRQGYGISLIHITAPDDVRWESIKERDKTFVQTTEADVREKGLLLPQRIQDTYLRFADAINFFYRGAVLEDARLAATWVRQADGMGELQIVDPDLYEQVKGVHNAAVRALKMPDLLWEATVERSSRVAIPAK